MKFLVVEADPELRGLLARILGEDGHEVSVVSTAEEAMEGFLRERFDGAVIDVVLPVLSGTDLCRWLRNQGASGLILLLSAKSTSSERVGYLDLGADDVINKPFDTEEVKARVRAFERRALGFPRPEMSVADLVVNPVSRTVRRGDRVLDLSKREFDLLDYLVRNAGQLVSRPMIAQAVWDREANLYTNVIDVFITFLRKKVDETSPRLIHTVRGKGFVLSATPPDYLKTKSTTTATSTK